MIRYHIHVWHGAEELWSDIVESGVQAEVRSIIVHLAQDLETTYSGRHLEAFVRTIRFKKDQTTWIDVFDADGVKLRVRIVKA